jgi:hypothetical protein
MFEELGYRRLEWRSADTNNGSKRSALRLGFSFEALFRQHMVAKGKNMNNAYYSIIDKEWPLVGGAMKEWLKEDNFDMEGKQRKKLEDIRKEMSGRMDAESRQE